MKSWIARASVLVAAPALALGASGEAMAYSGNTWVYLNNSSAPNGYSAAMVHVDDGDLFRVYDNYADGYGVRGYLEVNTSGWVQLHSSYNGKGYISYSQFERDVVGNNSYRIKVCTFSGIEDTSPSACSGWKYFQE
ncbi:hypothetical protein [Streptomyces sp. t39]|uniref:hypothetical protein n=1 Tax=Streptomyces sp. t39 TaxID=1828156 RepID=UPI0011CE2AA8|nr:hypothetical protein [Streptomyces sp. t39]TXS51003.1 hypothetical protein EAO77_24070 [Streptomyces sp. t39]